MTDKYIIDLINKDLLSKYRVLDGRPIDRLVWSADQIEVRVGKFTDWYGHILIREEYHAVRKIQKYWYFKSPCYVLEKLSFIRGYHALRDIAEELPESVNGSYETVYRFARVDGEETPLEVSARFVDFILWHLHNPRKTMPSDMIEDMLREEAQEVQEFEKELAAESENIRSPLFLWENGVVISTEQMKFREKNTYIERDAQITGVENAISIAN